MLSQKSPWRVQQGGRALPSLGQLPGCQGFPRFHKGSELALHHITYEEVGSVPFSVKAIGDELPCKSPRHNDLTCLVPSLMVCWLSHGHQCLPFGDATQMMPQPTVTENGTDPGNFGELCVGSIRYKPIATSTASSSGV
jgi:hypothetical protein